MCEKVGGVNDQYEFLFTGPPLKQIAVATQLTGTLMKSDLKEIAVKLGDKEGVSFGFKAPGKEG